MNYWYVYMAVAKTQRYYTGITTNPPERLKKHNLGKGSRFAIEQGPLRLVYVSQSFGSKSEARIREVRIKSWSKVKKEKLIKGEWILL